MPLRGLLLILSATGLPRIIFRLMLDKRVPFRAKLILPASLLYLISPLDFIPDIIPLAGWIDDIVAVLLSLVLFLSLTPSHVISEHLSRKSPQARKPNKDVIDGSYRHIDDDQE